MTSIFKKSSDPLANAIAQMVKSTTEIHLFLHCPCKSISYFVAVKDTLGLLKKNLRDWAMRQNSNIWKK